MSDVTEKQFSVKWDAEIWEENEAHDKPMAEGHFVWRRASYGTMCRLEKELLIDPLKRLNDQGLEAAGEGEDNPQRGGQA